MNYLVIYITCYIQEFQTPFDKNKKKQTRFQGWQGKDKRNDVDKNVSALKDKKMWNLTN